MQHEKELDAIIDRNKRVEKDKAWETSLTRRVIITVMTYLVMVLFLLVIGMSYPWLNALVPTAGFVLSTLSLPFFKNAWLKYVYSK